MNKSNNSLLHGALLLSIGGLLAKVLGALYRIPLTNILGSYGMGLYQLVFPPYILFLTLSQAGVPVALSRIIAECSLDGDTVRSRTVFRQCMRWLLITSLLGAVSLMLFSGAIASAQGNAVTAKYLVMVAPALVFVALTNVFKGYFQGNMNMLPSSATSVFEQVIKLAIGLGAAYYYMPDVDKAVGGAVIAITVSELVSLVIMATVYFVHRSNNKLPLAVSDRYSNIELSRQIMSLALPAALGGFVMQLSQVVDSVMVVKLITVPNATSLYGLWTGPVNSMIGLPIALSAGVATSVLPSITRTYASGDKVQLIDGYNTSIKLTLVISLPCALGMMCMSKQIIQLLYGSLPKEEVQISAVLLSLSALSIVFFAVVQTCVSLLYAFKLPYVAVVILAVAIVVKAIVNLALLPIASINIYGSAISELMCYLFSMICVIIYVSHKLSLRLSFSAVMRPLGASVIMTIALMVLVNLAGSFVATTLGTIVTIGIVGVLYIALIMAMGVFDTNGKLSVITAVQS